MRPDDSLESQALRALIEISQTVTSSLDLHEVLAHVIQAADTTVGVEASSLLLFEESTGELYFEVAEGDKSDAVRRVVVPLGEGVAGWVAQTRQNAVVNDVKSDPRFTGRVDNITGFKTLSLLCVPVVCRDRLLGVMELVNKCDGSGFDRRDLALCESIASLAAAAIYNARAHADKVNTARLTAMAQTVTGLAHAVKNTLTGIEGGAFILEKGLENDDHKMIAKGWGMVKSSNEYLADLVLDLLSFAKGRDLNYGKADINQICAGVVEAMDASGRDSSVAVRYEPCPEGAEAEVDRAGIRRVVLNLVTNAIDACAESESGIVLVHTEHSDGETICIRVADNGCGVAAENMPKLFREFFTTKGLRGTGLGLPVSHKIVSQHGGRIAVRSGEGEGAVFSVYLPVSPTNAG